jgi:hypothetical protein
MKRLAVSLLLLALVPLTVAAKDEPLKIEVANASAHATAVKVIALDAKVGSTFAVEGPDGKQVPCWYDKKAKKLLVLASVPAGGGTFTVHDGEKSKARMPAWGKLKTKEEGKVKLGKVVERVSAEFESDLFDVSIAVTKEVAGRVVIEAKKGDYKLELTPLGQSSGCVETEAIGKEVNESYGKGEKVHPEVFVVVPSVPVKIGLVEPNPFQRTVHVDCHTWARKNNDETLELFDEAWYEVTLTWGSPVVRVHSLRKQKTAYWNHNGVSLNEIYVDQPPTTLSDDATEQKTCPAGEGPIDFEAVMLVKDKTGNTVVHQPDFKGLKIYRECVFFKADRIMTVLSQSWHEGWKPIEIKAATYEDTMTIACDVDDKKPLKDWVAEFE